MPDLNSLIYLAPLGAAAAILFAVVMSRRVLRFSEGT